MRRPHPPIMQSGQKSGFTLLITITIASVLLATSLAVYSLSSKELVFAQYARESSRAYAAADRGMECALYWDRGDPQNTLDKSAYPTAAIAVWIPPLGAAWPGGVTCNNGTQEISVTGTTAAYALGAVTTFNLDYSDGTCVVVRVDKTPDNTYITSDGFSSCVSTDMRRAQRTLYSYSNF